MQSLGSLTPLGLSAPLGQAKSLVRSPLGLFTPTSSASSPPIIPTPSLGQQIQADFMAHVAANPELTEALNDSGQMPRPRLQARFRQPFPPLPPSDNNTQPESLPDISPAPSDSSQTNLPSLVQRQSLAPESLSQLGDQSPLSQFLPSNNSPPPDSSTPSQSFQQGRSHLSPSLQENLAATIQTQLNEQANTPDIDAERSEVQPSIQRRSRVPLPNQLTPPSGENLDQVPGTPIRPNTTTSDEQISDAVESPPDISARTQEDVSHQDVGDRPSLPPQQSENADSGLPPIEPPSTPPPPQEPNIQADFDPVPEPDHSSESPSLSSDGDTPPPAPPGGESPPAPEPPQLPQSSIEPSASDPTVQARQEPTIENEITRHQEQVDDVTSMDAPPVQDSVNQHSDAQDAIAPRLEPQAEPSDIDPGTEPSKLSPESETPLISPQAEDQPSDAIQPRVEPPTSATDQTTDQTTDEQVTDNTSSQVDPQPDITQPSIQPRIQPQRDSGIDPTAIAPSEDSVDEISRVEDRSSEIPSPEQVSDQPDRIQPRQESGTDDSIAEDTTTPDQTVEPSEEVIQRNIQPSPQQDAPPSPSPSTEEISPSTDSDVSPDLPIQRQPDSDDRDSLTDEGIDIPQEPLPDSTEAIAPDIPEADTPDISRAEEATSTDDERSEPDIQAQNIQPSDDINTPTPDTRDLPTVNRDIPPDVSEDNLTEEAIAPDISPRQDKTPPTRPEIQPQREENSPTIPTDGDRTDPEQISPKQLPNVSDQDIPAAAPDIPEVQSRQHPEDPAAEPDTSHQDPDELPPIQPRLEPASDLVPPLQPRAQESTQDPDAEDSAEPSQGDRIPPPPPTRPDTQPSENLPAAIQPSLSPNIDPDSASPDEPPSDEPDISASEAGQELDFPSLPNLVQRSPLGLHESLLPDLNLLNETSNNQRDNDSTQSDPQSTVEPAPIQRFSNLPATDSLNAPTSEAPSDWSSLEDLLGQTAQSRVATATEPLTESEPWADYFNGQEPITETLTNPMANLTETATDAADDAVTLTNPMAQTLGNALDGGSVDDQQLENLAQVIYLLLRDRLALERERQSLQTSIPLPWLNTVSHSNTSSTGKSTNRLPGAEQIALVLNTISSPSENAIANVCQEIYYDIYNKIQQRRDRSV